MPLYLIREPCDEGSTPTLAGQLLDAAGQPVGVDALDGLWLTLYDSHSLAVINGRSHQDALTLEGFTMDDLGRFAWVQTAADTPILDDCRRVETHVTLLEARWTAEGVARVAYLSIAVPVRNLAPPAGELTAAGAAHATTAAIGGGYEPSRSERSAPLDTPHHVVTPWGELETTMPWRASMPSDDPTQITMQERITLKKYDGDPPQPGEDKEPVETLVIEDGQIVTHITRKEA